MPEEHPDAEPSSAAGAPAPAGSGVPTPGSGTARSATGSPRPGHFLPGGAGDILTEGDRARAAAERRRSLDLGTARALTAPVDPTLRKKARPLPADPGTDPGFGAPPPAPLPGAPTTPLTGTRRTRTRQRTGWHQPYTRTGAQFSNDAPPITTSRRYSKVAIAGLSAFALLLVAGGTFAGFKLIGSYDSVDSPMARPTVKKSEAPLPVPADPTVTVTATPVPDMVRLQKNQIYVAGKVPVVNCQEPSIKPTTQSAILRYYQALLPCLNRAWEPLVKKAGYPFRPPKLRLVEKNTSSCVGTTDRSFYCGADETISMQWRDTPETYRDNAMVARVVMMDTLAHEYGHHVQMLTNILISSESREGWTKSNAAKLEWNRRKELQAGCFGAAFLGANKQALGIRGETLRVWEYLTQHSGDEYDETKVRDHGSAKNNWLWASAAFKSGNPSSCNTYTAPSKKVS